MLKNYTSNDLILYLYNETGLTDTVLIQDAIDTNYEVAEEFDQLVAVKTLLDDVAVIPKAETVESIMAYSKLSSFIA